MESCRFALIRNYELFGHTGTKAERWRLVVAMRKTGRALQGFKAQRRMEGICYEPV